jgi:hypothetical protein
MSGRVPGAPSVGAAGQPRPDATRRLADVRDIRGSATGHGAGSAGLDTNRFSVIRLGTTRRNDSEVPA